VVQSLYALHIHDTGATSQEQIYSAGLKSAAENSGQQNQGHLTMGRLLCCPAEDACPHLQTVVREESSKKWAELYNCTAVLYNVQYTAALGRQMC
jgi:hypothetical protein